MLANATPEERAQVESGAGGAAPGSGRGAGTETGRDSASRLTGAAPKEVRDTRLQHLAATALRDDARRRFLGTREPEDRARAFEAMAGARTAAEQREIASRGHLLAVLGTDHPPLAHAVTDRQLDARSRDSVAAAMGLLGRIAGRQPAVGPVPIVRQLKGDRSEYKKGRIHLVTGASPVTVAHEYGHHLETDTGTLKRTNAFWTERFHGTSPVHLNDLDPDKGHGPQDIGHLDKTGTIQRLFPGEPWRAAYVGKRITGRSGTEILTVGLELLYSDPVFFAETDPDYFGVVLDILRGVHDSGRRANV